VLGFAQGNLDQYVKISAGWPAVNATLFDINSQEDKDAYQFRCFAMMP
jgi:hypothetical protein